MVNLGKLSWLKNALKYNLKGICILSYPLNGICSCWQRMKIRRWSTITHLKTYIFTEYVDEYVYWSKSAIKYPQFCQTYIHIIDTILWQQKKWHTLDIKACCSGWVHNRKSLGQKSGVLETLQRPLYSYSTRDIVEQIHIWYDIHLYTQEL